MIEFPAIIGGIWHGALKKCRSRARKSCKTSCFSNLLERIKQEVIRHLLFTATTDNSRPKRNWRQFSYKNFSLDFDKQYKFSSRGSISNVEKVWKIWWTMWKVHWVRKEAKTRLVSRALWTITLPNKQERPKSNPFEFSLIFNAYFQIGIYGKLHELSLRGRLRRLHELGMTDQHAATADK